MFQFPVQFFYTCYVPVENGCVGVHQYSIPDFNWHGNQEFQEREKSQILPPSNAPSKESASIKEQEEESGRESRQTEKRKNKGISKIFFKHKRQKDEDFKQRKQTINRNLYSNTMKIYLKQIRKQNSQTFKKMAEMLKTYHVPMSPGQFKKRLAEEFPKEKTYVSYSKMKEMCFLDQNCLDQGFSKVLRVSLKNFFKFDIHMINISTTRTTRKIRSSQIRQGKSFLQEIYP